jgi:hypothetical protein
MLSVWALRVLGCLGCVGSISVSGFFWCGLDEECLLGAWIPS